MRRWPIALVLLVLAALSLPTRPALAHQLCFADKTPYCLDEPFSDYWAANGGLPVFGYPIAQAGNEPNRDTGQPYLTQWVERNRMEDHPENAGTPYRVLLGLLGKERLQYLGRDWRAQGREAGPYPGCLWFPETGHNVCNQLPSTCLPVADGPPVCSAPVGFKQYWETHGLMIPGLDSYTRSLQLFGLPLTPAGIETNANGDTVLTQWFERARFEWHPQNPNSFKVLLGLLGDEVLRAPERGTPTPAPTSMPPILPTIPRGPTATPAPTLAPGATPTPLPPSFNNCKADPRFSDAPNYPVRIVTVDKITEIVTIRNTSDTVVDLTGWRVCSVGFAQLHATLSGTLAPGEQRAISSQTGPDIWNDIYSDPGTLYDANGSLVSSWWN